MRSYCSLLPFLHWIYWQQTYQQLKIFRGPMVSAAHHNRSIKIAFSSLTLASWLHGQRVCVHKVYFDMIFNYVTSGHLHTQEEETKMNWARFWNVNVCFVIVVAVAVLVFGVSLGWASLDISHLGAWLKSSLLLLGSLIKTERIARK